MQSAGQLSPDEQAEHTELERIEHILIMLKARLQRDATDRNVH